MSSFATEIRAPVGVMSCTTESSSLLRMPEWILPSIVTMITVSKPFAIFVEQIHVFDVELKTDVVHRHLAFCIRREFLVSHHEQFIYCGIGDDPSIGNRCELSLCGICELDL